MMRRIGHGLVWIAVVPMLTYWLAAKSVWVHTDVEKLLLAGLVIFGALMFLAIMSTRHFKPAVNIADKNDRNAGPVVGGNASEP